MDRDEEVALLRVQAAELSDLLLEHAPETTLWPVVALLRKLAGEGVMSDAEEK
jgi:hypothetical protein